MIRKIFLLCNLIIGLTNATEKTIQFNLKVEGIDSCLLSICRINKQKMHQEEIKLARETAINISSTKFSHIYFKVDLEKNGKHYSVDWYVLCTSIMKDKEQFVIEFSPLITDLLELRLIAS